MVQFGLIVLNSAGGITTLARVALIVVMLCCVAVPLISRVWSLRTRPEPDDSVDLDALWEHYTQGDISWDEYLRGKIEGARGLVGTKAGSSSNSASDDVAS